MRRKLRDYGGNTVKYFASEDGKHYRGFLQDLHAVRRHVEHTSQITNEAPARGNRERWSYMGSVAITVVADWCQKRGATFDQWARNEGGLKDKFLQWYRHEYPKLMADTRGAKARPQIVVPTVYQARKNAYVEGADGAATDH